MIRSLTFAELQRYDVGRIRPGSEYARRFPHQQPVDGSRIPRLADVLRLETQFNIETKLLPDHAEETVGPEEFARVLIQEIRKAKAKATIQSFDYRTLKIVRRRPRSDRVPHRRQRPPAEEVRQASDQSPNRTTLGKSPWRKPRPENRRLTVNEPADIASALDSGIGGHRDCRTASAELKRLRQRRARAPSHNTQCRSLALLIASALAISCWRGGLPLVQWFALWPPSSPVRAVVVIPSFLHGGVAHIVFNMFALYTFARHQAARHARFYLFTTSPASFPPRSATSSSPLYGGPPVPTVGASNGITDCSPTTFISRTAVMLLIPPIPMKARSWCSLARSTILRRDRTAAGVAPSPTWAGCSTAG
jgi:hypothetical protein